MSSRFHLRRWLVLIALVALATTLWAFQAPGVATNPHVNAQLVGGCTGNCKTVKAAGGGDFTTIAACLSAMSGGGNTCTVFVGSYTESPTLKAGTVGNLNTLTVNAADACSPVGYGHATPTCGVVIHGSVAAASYTQFSGFEVTNSPHAVCYRFPATVTNAFVTSNYFFSCGGGGVGSESGMVTGTANSGADSASFEYINSNTFKTSCSSGWNCSVLELVGDHILVENNDMSDSNDWIEFFGHFVVARNNLLHDGFTANCQLQGSGGGSSNCHGDMFESEPVTSFNLPSQRTMFEGNHVTNMVQNGGPSGAEFHGFLLQSDGCGSNCFHSIMRFNLYYNIASYYALNDISSGTYPSVKVYNDTVTGGGPSDLGENFNAQGTTGTSAQASMVNELWYLYGTFSNSNNAPPHDVRNSTLNGGTNPFIDATSNWNLASGSAAIGAGTSLTKASNSGAGSTALTVTDAFFFQDGWGFPAGTGLGQMSPDWVRIGPTTTVQIASINYATNAMTLASPVSWSVNDPIYLYKDSTGVIRLTGALPNLGAF